MPTFLPISPVTMSSPVQRPNDLSPVVLAERLDLDVDASRQVELHQRVHRLRRRLEDVDQPLVGADLELLARLLVDMRRAQHRPLVLRGRQRDRSCEPGARALRCLDDLAGGLVENARVVGLETDADFVREHGHGYYSTISLT